MQDSSRDVRGALGARARRLSRFAPLPRGRPATLARWALAGALFLAAGVLAAHPAVASGEPTLATVVSARDLALGATLRPPDVEVVQMPVSLRPEGALDNPADVNGRTLIGLARRGEPLTDARLVGPRSRPPGTVTVPVRLADPRIAQLLHAGTRVDVVTLGTTERENQLPASAATVLTVLGRQGASRDGPVPDGEGPLVLLAVPGESAARLAAISLAQPVTVTLR